MQKKHFALRIIIALILTCGTSNVSAAIRTVTLKVQGMTCRGCATRVEEALKLTDGVEQVRVRYERGTAVIRYDDQKITVDKLREVVQSTGFFCEVKR